MKMLVVLVAMFVPASAVKCDGKDSGCTNIAEGDGDCDQDSDCQGNLTCGDNNCIGDQFDSDDDCCMELKPWVYNPDCNTCCDYQDQAKKQGDQPWAVQPHICELDQECALTCCQGPTEKPQVDPQVCIDALANGIMAILMALLGGSAFLILGCMCCGCLCCIAVLYGLYKLVAGREKTNVSVAPAAYEPLAA